MKQQNNIALRLLLYFLGLFIMTLGIALSVKSNLGVSPVSSIPYTMTYVWGIEMGKATILFHCVLVLLQILLLRKNFQIKNLLQVVVGIIFGYFTTFCNWGASFLPTPEHMTIRFVMILGSTILVAIGIFFYLPANVMPLAGEGAMQAVSQLTKIEFSKVKIAFDVSMVTISLITCLLLTHSLGSVGAGTILAAVLVGTVLGQLNKAFGGWRDRLLGIHREAEDAPTEENFHEEEAHYVITISREYGSGGREIGKLLAKELDIPFYDLDIIRTVAEKSGYSEAYVTKHEQKITNPALMNLYSWYTASASEEDLPKIEQLYQAQKKVIWDIAAKESCVIVGRLANFILKDSRCAFHVFISADIESKIKRVTGRDNINEEAARKQILKVEKERANHCYYFTHKQWGNAKYYDLMIKSNILGIPQSAELIGSMAKKYLPK
jgi:uncharacterized membrane protein YczE/cytidylate kinase